MNKREEDLMLKDRIEKLIKEKLKYNEEDV